MQSLQVGRAEVILRESDFDPWAEIEVVDVIVAYYLTSDNTMHPGSVLHEVDPEAFLPFYFKMTDFFTG